MVASSQIDDAPGHVRPNASADDHRQLFLLVARIAAIIFSVEAVIMVMLSGWRLTQEVVQEGLLDAALLTLLSTPLIYIWVALPFVRSARSARQGLARQLDERQRQAALLTEALAKSQALLTQNESLRRKLQLAGNQAAENNEQMLQRIGADLHDGPAQLLAFAMMRFGRLSTAMEAGDVKKGTAELKSVRAALADTLREVRDISTGLAPPGIAKASLGETIAQAIALHEQHTGTSVRSDVDNLDLKEPEALKICVYRFLQEALSNAYRHGGGIAQAVTAKWLSCDEQRIAITVSDGGPGFSTDTVASGGLGLFGIRARVEALGGKLTIDTDASRGGVSLTASFDLAMINAREQQL